MHSSEQTVAKGNGSALNRGDCELVKSSEAPRGLAESLIKSMVT